MKKKTVPENLDPPVNQSNRSDDKVSNVSSQKLVESSVVRKKTLMKAKSD